MLPAPEHLTETHLIGSRCREWVLGPGHLQPLRTAKLMWVGHSALHAPYRMVRLRSQYSHVVACFGGSGRTQIDGRNVNWGPGKVLLAPRDALHAFEIVGRGPWRIAWVFFDDHDGPPVVPGGQTRLVTADASDFVSSLQMLTREANGAAHLALLQSLVSLVNAYARRLAGSPPVDERLWRLWDRVEGDLGHNWDGRSLARVAALSDEHLRRLCHRHLRRSPMAHLTQLRMQRACTLLSSSNSKIEEIALRVGFSSLYSFSAAFKRWCGVPPSDFRSGKSTGAHPHA